MPWFKVTAERFDYMPKPRVMLTFKHGHIGYQTRECVNAGVAAGLIEVIAKPKNAKVDKSGKVVWDNNVG